LVVFTARYELNFIHTSRLVFSGLNSPYFYYCVLIYNCLCSEPLNKRDDARKSWLSWIQNAVVSRFIDNLIRSTSFTNACVYHVVQRHIREEPESIKRYKFFIPFSKIKKIANFCPVKCLNPSECLSGTS
jgi:hypothetical protein